MAESAPSLPACQPNWLEQGLAHHRSGRLVQAARCYQQAHEQDGGNAGALLLLSILARHARQMEPAIALAAEAARLRPDDAGLRLGLASALLAAGKVDEAEQECRAALALHPEMAAAWRCLGEALVGRGDRAAAFTAWERAGSLEPNDSRAERLRGDLWCREGNFEEAIAAYRAGLAKTPQDAKLHYVLGAALAAGGYRRQAEDAYRSALRLRPNFPEVLLNLGNLFYDERRFAAAALCCRKALALRPGYAKAWCNLGNALQMLGSARAATQCYERTLCLAPEMVAAQHNQGNAWMALRDFLRAERCFRRALAQDATRAEHHNSLGNALYGQRNDDAAEACYRRALALDPGYAAAHTNLANAMLRRGQRADSLAHYERALQLDPSSAGGHYNLGLACLRTGRFAEGWREHEWRWDFHELRLRRRRFAAPQWGGEPLHGQTILLHAEQGLGDSLQFIRYVPLVAERGGRVVLEVQPRLAHLLRGLDGAVQVIARGDPLPEFAWHCPLMSLPPAFATTVDTIPRNVPYVRADPEEAAAARRRWPGEGLRVGLAWAGNPRCRSDEERSMPLERLLPLADVAGVSWFSLQMGAACGQMVTLRERFPLADASSASRDLAETAALIATLDLVITVDTSIAHLAGAMALPVWIVLPVPADWRWMDDRDDSPWYPTARLFRQRACGDWSRPVLHMRTELRALAESVRNPAKSLG